MMRRHPEHTNVPKSSAPGMRLGAAIPWRASVLVPPRRVDAHSFGASCPRTLFGGSTPTDRATTGSTGIALHRPSCPSCPRRDVEEPLQSLLPFDEPLRCRDAADGCENEGNGTALPRRSRSRSADRGKGRPHRWMPSGHPARAGPIAPRRGQSAS